MPALNPGRYSIAATIEGFRPFERDGIALQVSQVARIDLRLEVGGAGGSVEVTAPVSMLETETSGRGSVIDRQKIVKLPLDDPVTTSPSNWERIFFPRKLMTSLAPKHKVL